MKKYFAYTIIVYQRISAYTVGTKEMEVMQRVTESNAQGLFPQGFADKAEAKEEFYSKRNVTIRICDVHEISFEDYEKLQKTGRYFDYIKPLLEKTNA